MLLDAGADPSTRDNSGKNLIHGLLEQLPRQLKQNDHEAMQKMLELLDPAQRQEMMLERNSYGSGANTPLHQWLDRDQRQYTTGDDVKNCMGTTILRMLLNYSNGEDLYMVDGSGDTPVHKVVQAQNYTFLKVMLDAYPSCIWRENAVGRTPAELAMGTWLRKRVTSTPIIGALQENNYDTKGRLLPYVQRKPGSFVRASGDGKSMEDRIWELCQECMNATPAKRKLIPLNEANEVAKRLAATEASRNYRYGNRVEEEEEEGDGKEVFTDEVSDWYGGSAATW
jgi:hypothetical protein